MMERIIAVYDTAEHAVHAINALRRAGVPVASIHRQVFDGEHLEGEHPPIVQHHESTIWSVLFGGANDEHLVYEDSDEASGTVVRVTHIPPDNYEAVLDILTRYHPSDVLGRASE